MKKTLALLLALFMFIATFTGCADENPGKQDPNNEDNQPPVQDAENPATDFEYEENEDGGITIKKYIGTDADVIIPEQIDGKDVTVVGGFWAAYDFLSSVAFPNTVTTIKESAFWRCNKLTTVTLSQNLTTINRDAFSECTSLANIVLPASLETIKTRAFYGCTSLKHINIPAKLTTWWDEVFLDCKIETVDIAEGVTSIPDIAFAHNNIKKIVLPSSMKEIGIAAFAYCENLESVVLNDGLETIGNQAFRGSALTEIVIPKTVANISEMAFNNCKVLKKVYFEGAAPEAYVNTIASDPPMVPENVDYTVYYHEGAEGFTSPEWCGYPAKIW